MIFHTFLVLFLHASGKQTVSRILLSWKVWMPTRYKSPNFTCMSQLQKGLFTFLWSFRSSCQGRIILEATFQLFYFTCDICHLFCEGWRSWLCFTFADLCIGNLYMYNLVRLPHPRTVRLTFGTSEIVVCFETIIAWSDTQFWCDKPHFVSIFW